MPSVPFLTAIFVGLIFFAATQDIAVDGWALTLLSHDNLSYASTAQTIGLNVGYFMSFTVFLAFNSVEFGCVFPSCLRVPRCSEASWRPLTAGPTPLLVRATLPQQ